MLIYFVIYFQAVHVEEGEGEVIACREAGEEIIGTNKEEAGALTNSSNTRAVRTTTTQHPHSSVAAVGSSSFSRGISKVSAAINTSSMAIKEVQGEVIKAGIVTREGEEDTRAVVTKAEVIREAGAVTKEGMEELHTELGRCAGRGREVRPGKRAAAVSWGGKL